MTFMRAEKGVSLPVRAWGKEGVRQEKVALVGLKPQTRMFLLDGLP
jgi:hypothetical protein